MAPPNYTYSNVGIVIHDMVISYGESLWPGTSPRLGENRSGQLHQARPTRWVGGKVAILSASAASIERRAARRAKSFRFSFA